MHSPTHLTMDSLLAHAESTSSTFLYLVLALLSHSSSETFSHAASHLGVSHTISTLLRSLPYHASKGRMVIPAEITARHDVNHEEVFRKGGHAKGIDNAVFEFATVANDHLITAREMLKEGGGKVPEGVRPVFLSAVSCCCILTFSCANAYGSGVVLWCLQIPTALYLERLEKSNFDAFDHSLQVRTWRLPWRMWQGYYKATF